MLYGIMKEVFIEDCEQNYGYTKEESEELYKVHEDDFIEDMADDFWTNWSNNFPVTDKEE